MTMKTRLLLLPFLLAACDARDPSWDQTRTVLGPVALKDEVAYVDVARNRVVIVDAGARPGVRAIPVGQRPLLAQPSPTRDRLLVVSRGREAIYEGEVDESPGLFVVDAVAGTSERFELGSPFDRLAVSSDGKLAVAYFSDAAPDGEDLFRNPNELAIVRLDQPGSRPTLRTIRSFGEAPLGVVLSPPMSIPGTSESRTLAFVLSPGTLTILDASHPDRREVSVRLSDGSSATITPQELAFAPASGTAYLRASGARDIMEIVLSYEAPEGELDNDYHPALADLGANAAPADVAVFDDANGVRRVLAAMPSTHEVAVIEADTARFITIDTLEPVDRILLLPPGAPRVAVLASLSTRAGRLQLLDLTRLGDELTAPNVETISLEVPIFAVVPVPGDGERALVVHDADRTVLGVLDVAAATVAPVEGLGRLDSFSFSAGGTHLVGATAGEPRVGVVDLSNIHPWSVRLDDNPGDVFALASGGIFVDHGGSFGRATVLPSADSGRADAIVFSGFLISDLFDERF
jgi:hypothetical protein